MAGHTTGLGFRAFGARSSPATEELCDLGVGRAWERRWTFNLTELQFLHPSHGDNIWPPREEKFKGKMR